MPSCGEVQTSRQCNRASRFSGHLLGTTITCRTNWKGLPSTNASWTFCLQCQTSSRVGCFLCIAHQPGRTTCCALCAQTVWECVCTLLNIPIHQDQSTRDTATLPLSLGGLGLRSAVRTSPSAFWASWADCFPMISARHPAVVDMIIRELDGHPVTPCLSAASRIVRDLVGVGGFEPPSWISLVNGARPHMRQPEEYEPGGVRQGWQHEAASRVERVFRDAVLMLRLADHRVTCVPTSPLLQFDPQLFRILFLRRLRLHLPLTSRACRCGRQIDPFGHHRCMFACRCFGKVWVCG